MAKIMTTNRDLRNWVDDMTNNYLQRTDGDVDTITNGIQDDDHPAWGTDWSDYLETLELDSFLPVDDALSDKI